ncbi:CU044_2847 family protein [Crocosphaera sp.]|uniref:CU044_2847 family protein n=1 Tax=Crocosphaera sp. TaxID=2729996 RepID=UPI002610BCF8|nr:CU044_2847 family protein [Crocosphaera sp.]MDJ0582754.1 CU044_2847 family protein [Crocosphaera sp.]
MGKKLIKLEDGTLVEVEVPGEELEPISGGLAQKVKTTFDMVEPLLVNSCRPIVKAWEKLNEEVMVEGAEVEIGLSFTGEGNLYITKSTASANLKVKLTLKPQRTQE